MVLLAIGFVLFILSHHLYGKTVTATSEYIDILVLFMYIFGVAAALTLTGAALGEFGFSGDTIALIVIGEFVILVFCFRPLYRHCTDHLSLKRVEKRNKQSHHN